MSEYRRYFVPGGTYFFTVVSDGRRPFLCDPLARPILGEAFRTIKQKLPFEMPAIVLLPDHLHAMWSLPPGDDEYPVRWRRIKEEFTQNYLANGGIEGPISESRKARGERGIWQPRYWEHVIRDETDFERHFDYIHYNPVKHGYARSPASCAYSSFHRWVGLGFSHDLRWGSTASGRLDFSDLDETCDGVKCVEPFGDDTLNMLKCEFAAAGRRPGVSAKSADPAPYTCMSVGCVGPCSATTHRDVLAKGVFALPGRHPGVSAPKATDTTLPPHPTHGTTPSPSRRRAGSFAGSKARVGGPRVGPGGVLLRKRRQLRDVIRFDPVGEDLLGPGQELAGIEPRFAEVLEQFVECCLRVMLFFEVVVCQVSEIDWLRQRAVQLFHPGDPRLPQAVGGPVLDAERRPQGHVLIGAGVAAEGGIDEGLRAGLCDPDFGEVFESQSQVVGHLPHPGEVDGVHAPLPVQFAFKAVLVRNPLFIEEHVEPFGVRFERWRVGHELRLGDVELGGEDRKLLHFVPRWSQRRPSREAFEIAGYWPRSG